MPSFSASTLVPSITGKSLKHFVSSLSKSSQRSVEEIFGNVSANTVSSQSLENISLFGRTFISFQLYRFLDLMSTDEKTELVDTATMLIEKYYQYRVDTYDTYNKRHMYSKGDAKYKNCKPYRFLIATLRDWSECREDKIIGCFKFKNVMLSVLMYRRPVRKFKNMTTVNDIKKENKVEIFEQGRKVISQDSRCPIAFPSHLLG